MKLAIVTFEYAGITHPTTGGIGNWIANLAPALANYGHEVNVLTTDPNTSGLVVTPEGVAVHREKAPKRHGAAIDIVRGLTWPRSVKRWLLAQPEIDLVIAPEYGGMAASFAVSPNRARLVTQLHGSSEQMGAYRRRRFRTRSAIPAWMTGHREVSQTAHSEAVLGCSRAVLDDTLLRWKLNPPFSSVMPNVLDLERITQLAQGPPPALPAGRYVLFFGRLSARKGTHILAEAMKDVLAVHPDVYLVLAGADSGWQGGPMVGHVRRILGDAAHRVIYLGELTHATLLPLIAMSDVVALPSVFDNFPYVVLETIALGRPLIATSGHGIDDIVTDGLEALMVPPGSSGALAIAINRLLDDGQLSGRLGESAALRAQKFGYGSGAAQVTQLLAEVIARTPNPNDKIQPRDTGFEGTC